MTEWECDDCGLIHCHDKTLHSLWDHIDWEFCKKLEYNPMCNCGTLEAMKRGFFDSIHEPAVPPATREDIESKY